MEDARKPAVAITMGDPCGIGPEVVVKALADPWVYASCRPLVVGNTYAMQRAVDLIGSPLRVNRLDDPSTGGQDPNAVDVVDIGNLNSEDITVGQINPTCGKAAREWVTKAGGLAQAGTVDALATAPLNKEAASLAGYKAIGHMELLQELTGSKTGGEEELSTPAKSGVQMELLNRTAGNGNGYSSNRKCPECNNQVIFQEGCSKCMSCGWNKCE